MNAITALGYETYYLGLRTTRRFLRVPANIFSAVFFPLVQLLVFSQLFKDIVQLPSFGGQSSYLAYLAPGQVAFAAQMAVTWSAFGFLYEYRIGYLDKLRASPIRRTSILLGELVPLFIQAALMSAILLIVALVLGVTIASGPGGFLLIVVMSGLFGVALSGISFIPALLTRSEQATSTLGLLLFPLMFASTAFVPEAAMPAWMRAVNTFNPVTYLIEAIRSLIVVGYDWGAVGSALVAMAAVGFVLLSGTMLSFRRLTS